jgi:cell wall-associated NlpC family hydrolase
VTIPAVAEVQSRIATIQARFAGSAASGAPVVSTAPLNSGSAPSATTNGTGPSFASALAAQSSYSAGSSAATATSASSASSTVGSRAAGGVDGGQVVAAARKYLGVPYVWGGTDPAKGLDCSGLVQRVYKDLGIDLPRVSKDQAREGTRVASMAEARPGDLLAFDNSSSRAGIDHIAIYLGGGKMIEAPRPGKDVRITDVPGTPEAIRRVLPSGGTAAEPGIAPVRAAAGGGAGVAGVPYADLFTAAAARHGVPAALLAGVAKVESGFKANAVSHAGAQGLMQLMPGTARGLGVNALDPKQAVDGAARLLKDHLKTFGSLELALAAYNAGPGAVRKYDGIPPYAETRAYVPKVLAAMKGFS